jgi:antirestriction protein ArdC
VTSPTTLLTLPLWLEKLRSDRKEIFRAAADAQRIADYLLAFHPDYAARNSGGGEAIADTGDATGEPSELGDTLGEAA